jgi:hypothetical protein
MAFYGDAFTQDRTMMFCGVPADADMTAIVRLYIPEGFVIAADGLRTHSENPALNVETAQKIFRIDGKGKHLACACTGAALITRDNSEEIVLDFMEEAEAASQRLYYQRYKNLHGYAAALSGLINLNLDDIKRSGKIAAYPPPARPLNREGDTSIIAELWLDGFYDEVPSRVDAVFRYDGQGLLEPAIIDRPVALGNLIVQGPNTPGFTVLQGSSPRSLDEAVEAARRYIASCSDAESIALDPEACANIGGHIHVATITKDAGFRWAISPIG